MIRPRRAQPRVTFRPDTTVGRRNQPPRIERQFQHPGYGVEIHRMDCGCPDCEPYAPSIEPRLTATDMGKLAVLGAIVGSAIAFAIDPAGAARALLATVGL